MFSRAIFRINHRFFFLFFFQKCTWAIYPNLPSHMPDYYYSHVHSTLQKIPPETKTPTCIITIKIVTHIFAAEIVTYISAAETFNCIITSETVTRITVTERFTNITVTESTTCIIAIEPRNLQQTLSLS